MGHRNQRRADSRFGVPQAAVRPGEPRLSLGEILGFGEIR